jgi:hypothetical protein
VTSQLGVLTEAICNRDKRGSRRGLVPFFGQYIGMLRHLRKRTGEGDSLLKAV